MKYIIKKYFFFFSSKVAGANVRVGGQMRRAPACFDIPAGRSVHKSHGLAAVRGKQGISEIVSSM